MPSGKVNELPGFISFKIANILFGSCILNAAPTSFLFLLTTFKTSSIFRRPARGWVGRTRVGVGVGVGERREGI